MKDKRGKEKKKDTEEEARKEERASDTDNNVDDSYRHADWKKPGMEKYLHSDPIYMKFSIRQN